MRCFVSFFQLKGESRGFFVFCFLGGGGGKGGGRSQLPPPPVSILNEVLETHIHTRKDGPTERR